MAGALDNVVGGSEQGAATKGENDRIGMQWTQATEMQIGPKVEFGPDQLGGNDHPHQHSDNPPDDGHHGKLPHHLVVVC
jgi:hypothetical protein